MDGPLRIGLGVYDRTLPLMAGLVRIEGVEATFDAPPLETLFARAFDEVAYDVAELSFSNFMLLTALGKSPYVGLPVFPSRAFRHSAVYVRTDRAIRGPRDLAGRRVGVREFTMTAALVARGVLEDEYGLASQDVHWVSGPADASDSVPIVRVRPAGVRLDLAAPGENLSDLLLSGAIDAMVAYKPPPAYLARDGLVQRLFEDYEAIEADYARRTGRFPIMHLVGIRRELAETRPDLAVRVCEALDAAQAYAVRRAREMQAPFTVHPWGASAIAEAGRLLPDAFWRNGVEANRATIEALARYSHRQGISPRELAVEELFAAPTLDWAPPAP